MSEEYDLRKSTKKIGQLYPVILSKDGKVVDGFHRLKSVSGWRTEVHEDLDSQEKILTARLIANKFRRQVTAQEVEGWINELAEIALTEYKIEPGKITDWIAESTGYAHDTVTDYLSEKYKMKERVLAGKKANLAGSEPAKMIQVAKAKLTPTEFEAVKTEAKKEVKEEVKAEVREEVKKDLRKDPEFITEVIETAPVVLPTLKPSPVTKGGYYRPALTQKEAHQLQTIIETTEREIEKKQADPKVQERAKWVKMWLALGNVLGVLDSLYCPVCGEPATTNLVFKCHPENTLTIVNKLVKEKLGE